MIYNEGEIHTCVPLAVCHLRNTAVFYSWLSCYFEYPQLVGLTAFFRLTPINKCIVLYINQSRAMHDFWCLTLVCFIISRG